MKLLKLILFICGLILITGQVFAAEVALDPSTKIITQGQTFDLGIIIDPAGARIAGAQANIGFNSLLFRVNNISEGDLFNRNGTNTFFNAGTINNSTGMAINIFNSIIGNRNVTTRGTFIIINVTAIGIRGTSGFDLSNVKISDPNGMPVKFNATNGNFTISASPINVVSPNGGETWIRGTSNTITWNKTGIQGPEVKLELLKNESLVGTITPSTPNDGSHAWLITSTRALGSDYKIRVSSTSNLASKDASDNYFTIGGINVNSPNGGETWIRGTSNTITWNSSGIPGPEVKLELLKNGSLVGTITPSTPNDGSHAWLITSRRALGTDYKIRVTSTSNFSYKDTSDNYFTIGGINVNSPNGGETWIRGTSNTITWNSSGILGPVVKLELLKNGSLVGTITPSTPNDGSHAWLITSSRAQGTDYKIRVTSTGNFLYKDISDNNFTIT